VPQIFHRSFNTLSKASIAGVVLVLCVSSGALYIVGWSPYVTQANIARVQPVEFSHAHHVGQLGIDCRYCHTSVENSPFAGIPPTKICMNCHQEIWVGAATLEPVRTSYRTGQSIAWERIHNLPQFAYFDHSIHVNKGVGCVECHGRVDEMPFMYQDKSLLMGWCLDCHRNPKVHLRPHDEVFNLTWQPSGDRNKLADLLYDQYHIKSTEQLTSCSTCHR
jgi:Cytochrome c7 and related cytochrome c